MSLYKFARRLTDASPRTKDLIMIGSDAVFLPLCMLTSVVLRLGSIEGAVDTALHVQVLLGLLTLPVLGLAGLYRTVVRYLDLRVLLAAGLALGGVVLSVYSVAALLQIHVLPRSALLIYWFVAFAYVVASRFAAGAVLRRGMKTAAGTSTPRRARACRCTCSWTNPRRQACSRFRAASACW